MQKNIHILADLYEEAGRARTPRCWHDIASSVRALATVSRNPMNTEQDARTDHMTIHKYVLGAGTTEIRTHARSRFLHAATQHGEPTLWAEVDTRTPVVVRRVQVVPTGGDVPVSATYLGTAVDVGGYLVFHAYLLSEEP